MTDLDLTGLEAASEAAWLLWDGDDDTGVWDFIQTAMPHAIRAYIAASAPSPSPPDTDERLIDAAYDRRGTSDE